VSGRISSNPCAFASPDVSQFLPSERTSPGLCVGRNSQLSAVAASITNTAFKSSLPVK
jgi:hypothetical protein